MHILSFPAIFSYELIYKQSLQEAGSKAYVLPALGNDSEGSSTVRLLTNVFFCVCVCDNSYKLDTLNKCYYAYSGTTLRKDCLSVFESDFSYYPDSAWIWFIYAKKENM